MKASVAQAVALVLSFAAHSVWAADNGLAITPQMGWVSNSFFFVYLLTADNLDRTIGTPSDATPMQTSWSQQLNKLSP